MSDSLPLLQSKLDKLRDTDLGKEAVVKAVLSSIIELVRERMVEGEDVMSFDDYTRCVSGIARILNGATQFNQFQVPASMRESHKVIARKYGLETDSPEFRLRFFVSALVSECVFAGGDRDQVLRRYTGLLMGVDRQAGFPSLEKREKFGNRFFGRDR